MAVAALRGRVVVNLTAQPQRSFDGRGTLLHLSFAARTPRPQTQLTMSRVDLKDAGGALAASVRPTALTLRVGS